MRKINVSDISLRAIQENELSLSFREKLNVAQKLDASKVDAIELPLLVNNKENAVINRTIASSIKNAVVKIPVGDSAEGVASAFECAKNANKACLQVIMPLSTAQMEYFYHIKAPMMQEKIVELVKLSKQVQECVEFVALDAFRAEKGFVSSCAKSAFENGACCITICDDAGVALPEDYQKLIKEIKSVCDIKVFVQPSNALDLATACAISAIKAGADGIKTSSCGSYLSLSTFASVYKNKKFDLDIDCSADVTVIDTLMNEINGITQFEADEKIADSSKIVSGNLSIADVQSIVKDLGYELSDDDLGKVFEEFNKVLSKKESVDSKEIEAIIASTAMQVPSTYHLVTYVVNSGNIIPATANITLEKDGQKFTGVSTGDGPIDAAFHAIEQVVGHHYELDDFQVHAVTKGRGAVGSSIIRLRANGKLYPGNGVSTDIVGACIRAYVNALNKIVYEKK